MTTTRYKIVEFMCRAELYRIGADGLEEFICYVSGPRMYRWESARAVEVSS